MIRSDPVWWEMGAGVLLHRHELIGRGWMIMEFNDTMSYDGMGAFVLAFYRRSDGEGMYMLGSDGCCIPPSHNTIKSSRLMNGISLKAKRRQKLS